MNENIEETIEFVLREISIQGYSTQPPFDIGEIEVRMEKFARENSIILSSSRLYMSAKQLQHCMRNSKTAKGLVVEADELIHFPKNRFAMKLYFDGECFIYTNGVSKFIIHPNYELKIDRDKKRVVNFITATRIKDKQEFNGKRYTEVKTDRDA